MRNFGFTLCASIVLLSASASAHFDLKAPPTPAASVDGKGDPPCGPDTTEGVVTQVTGGSQLALSINETVRHGGFYRVALALKSCKKGADCFPADNKVYDSKGAVLSVTGPGNSDHADTMATPVFPILADNLFPHVQAGNPESYSGMVPLPNINCDKCTLQVIEFMAPHGPNPGGGYFYHHCADLKITADPAKPIFDPNGSGGSGMGGAAGSGGSASSGAGGGGTGGGGGGAGGAGGGPNGVNTGGTGVATGGMPASSGTTATTLAGSATTTGSGGTGTVTNPGGGAAQDSGSCGLAKRTRGGASALAALGLLFALGRRRRARPAH